MPPADPALVRIRAICLGLPDTKETMTWGSPHFRVGDKIFAGFGVEKGIPALGFKLEPGHAKVIVQQAGFWPAPYVGHKGWVSMDVRLVNDWDEVAALVLESYRLIAPKKSLAKLEAGVTVGAAKKKSAKKVSRRAAKAVPARRRRSAAPRNRP